MRSILLYLMALVYVAAGTWHFMRPLFYARIMPPWLPMPMTLIYISGIVEIILGLLLLPAATRPFAAWGIIALLIVVFPANVQMAINFSRQHNPYLWVAILRLPLQLILIWWAYVYTKK